MKLISYYLRDNKTVRAGWIHNGKVYDMEETYRYLAETRGEAISPPVSLLDYLNLPQDKKKWLYVLTREKEAKIPEVCEEKGVKLAAPIPRPPSFRDFYAFEEHVKTARRKRGLDMVPEWYKFPVFYFSNASAIKGSGEPVEKPSYTEWLDYELEVACVIGKEGRNIKREQALDYIEGFMILNDWSARDVQREEVKVGLGPAKGKDFATSMGPYLLTKDELEDRRNGEHYDLEMKAFVNGKLLSQGNMKTLYFSFAQMIERASQDCTLYPGDVIGSGTVGTGCILELGAEVHRWLEKGDTIELSIERLGVLRNEII
ncbi:fumarylacetoacetate hydrolase family protein [Aneurinibacillus thermoaerophilus]|uniref:Fumarylacetoacetate (FAA) hydrolase n=1 Tax=Aneurinibacillus thermoaerophilus TaxID=143495 RepID=A0A1G8C7Y0_ANETH|nr:fumarylacetoacetate hydrolase family protein [Aneurinibacillus thermoaerophilus]MED0738247.1 fumarylacetoacetate hydrolase family protein [Aneurinibacillus thermoaerophilus]QYY42968.1 fumarylacetoacetate hydrolase family protein [Aneurinibacillus thermoaerophilus]SDH41413.1 fumarylacetoacetate (FAA) hydrolase [Aneurinibacillus thermoaerophilus]